jgi:arylsulfatase A-like enzyme
VDRIIIREATLGEVVRSLNLHPSEGPIPKAAPRWRFEKNGEHRDVLLTATPGHLKLTIGSGPKKRFRFGIAFPFERTNGHSEKIALEAVLRPHEGKEIPLYRETHLLEDMRGSDTGWIERGLDLPPLAEEGSLLLKSRCEDEGRAIVAWGAPMLASFAGADTPPNIVLFSIDTLRPDRTGPYGGTHPAGVSPFMDRIARESILFENAVTQAPYTLPSHVSMMSGQYPTVHKVQNIHKRIDPERTPLLASILARAGYVTGAFTGGRLVNTTFGFGSGFDTYSEFDPCRGAAAERPFEWLKANGHLPFFLFFHTYVVHDYACDDPEYIERFDPGCTSTVHHSSMAHGFTDWPKEITPSEADRKCLDNRYAAGIRMADDGMKSMVEFLDSMGLMENTVIVITSDHGEELLDRGRVQHGYTLYEELIRVPLIIRPPGGTAPRRIQDLVEVIDIFPTLLDVVRLPLPEVVQGNSLMNFLNPEYGGTPDRIAFSEVDFASRKYALRSDAWKIIYNPKARSDDKTDHKEYELYDLQADPDERKDLALELQRHENLQERMTAFRDRLRSIADSIEGQGDARSEIDPELLNELRAQGYVK